MLAILGLVFAVFLHPVDGAQLVRRDGIPYVHIYSTDWYMPGADPAVRTRALNQVAYDHPGEQVQVCVRSFHYRDGMLRVQWPKLTEILEVPHDRGRLATRCVTTTVVDHPRWARYWGPLEVREGTYIHETNWHVVHGLVRQILVRDAPEPTPTPEPSPTALP